MNVLMLLKPKKDVAYIYETSTLRQGLEKMRHHGYKVIPVITREGRYVGTVSEGDFLWRLLCSEHAPIFERTMRDLESLPVREILHPDGYPSVGITASMEETRSSFSTVASRTAGRTLSSLRRLAMARRRVTRCSCRSHAYTRPVPFMVSAI